MRAFRLVPDVLGTAVLLFAGYIFLVSLKDVWRYVRISNM
jgi:hypothetical protein